MKALLMIKPPLSTIYRLYRRSKDPSGAAQARTDAARDW